MYVRIYVYVDENKENAVTAVTAVTQLFEKRVCSLPQLFLENNE